MSMSVKLENKKTKISLGNEKSAEVLTYVKLLQSIIGRQAVNTAWSLDELKTRLNVIDALESADPDVEFIEFNDKSIELIKKEVSEAKWVIAHIDIVNFVEYIEKLK